MVNNKVIIVNNKENGYAKEKKMCTCINLKTKDNYFGRNLDLECGFGEKVVITPRNYEFKLRKEQSFKTKYAMIGMATVIDNYPLYAEASNEKGLSIAGLYFPGYAYYKDEEKEKINITPFELTPWILGNFKSIEELKKVLNNINLVNISFSEKIKLTPMHFMISDTKDCIVIEQIKEGLKIYDNEVGVLTNSPPFIYHLTNLNNYLNLTANFAENRFTDKIGLKAYSNGMGTIGLPGDTSSSSRFIRATFNKINSVCNEDEESSISQFFHILDSVSMTRGSTITENKKYDITNYSCCININKGIYYYKTYENNQITAIRMNENNMNDNKLYIHELIQNQQIKYIN